MAAAAIAGFLDAARTAAQVDSQSSVDTLKVMVSIFGFDVVFLALGGLCLAAIGALSFPRQAGDPRLVLHQIGGSVWPEDPGERILAGLTLAGWVGAGLVFTATLFLSALAIIESMRTPEFAAAATALVAVGLALPILAIRSMVMGRVRRWQGQREEPGPLTRHVSPPAVLAAGAATLVPVLWVARDRIAAVIQAVDLEPWFLVLAGLAVAAALALVRPVASWPRAVRIGTVLGVPLLALLALVATLAVFGTDNTTRIILTSQGRISPLAYRSIKVGLDFDGDWQLSFMGEGDCAPFDSTRYSTAPEIPNNGVDEDCDGTDLILKFSEEARRGRWDHPVTGDIPDPLHVILISLDAAAPSRMSLHGYERPTTPVLGDLARESVWFTQAYSQGPSTRLAFPAMFTSRYDTQIARRPSARIPLELQTSNILLAEVMKRAEYHTIAVLPTTYFKNWKGLRQGFDRVVTDALKAYRKPVYHNAEQVTDSALEALEGLEQERIFMWVHYYDPHGPYTPPPDGPRFGKKKPDIYDAELAYTDREVGRLLAGLEKVLPPERTLVIITGDHGEAFDPAHPKRHHGHDLHSLVLHVPFLIHAPFLESRKVETPASTMDILPTLVNLLDIGGKYAFEGTSLVPEIMGHPQAESHLVFHQFYLPENVHHKKKTLRHVGVRSDELYLIMDLTNNTQQLYAYGQDPYETRNLALSMPKAVSILKKEVTNWMARVVRK